MHVDELPRCTMVNNVAPLYKIYWRYINQGNVHVTVAELGLWCLMPFQQYFSYIVEVSFITGRKRSTWRKQYLPQVTYKLYNIEYTSLWVEFELATWVMIGTDCTGCCKSNYHAITAPVTLVESVYSDDHLLWNLTKPNLLVTNFCVLNGEGFSCRLN